MIAKQTRTPPSPLSSPRPALFLTTDRCSLTTVFLAHNGSMMERQGPRDQGSEGARKAATSARRAESWELKAESRFQPFRSLGPLVPQSLSPLVPASFPHPLPFAPTPLSFYPHPLPAASRVPAFLFPVPLFPAGVPSDRSSSLGWLGPLFPAFNPPPPFSRPHPPMPFFVCGDLSRDLLAWLAFPPQPMSSAFRP